jgi:hypothetical protein
MDADQEKYQEYVSTYQQYEIDWHDWKTSKTITGLDGSTTTTIMATLGVFEKKTMMVIPENWKSKKAGTK